MKELLALLLCSILTAAMLVAQNSSPNDSHKTPTAEPSTRTVKVALFVVVDRDGYPHDVKVAKSASKELDKRAVDAVKRWKFEPAKKNGERVAVKVSVEVDFTCDENNQNCSLTSPRN